MKKQDHKFAFVSTMETDPWGGSEELWSRVAQNLLCRGHSVAASVQRWAKPDIRIVNLEAAGVSVHFRDKRPVFLKRAWRRTTQGGRTDLAIDCEKFLEATSPSLAVFSDSGPFPPTDVLELCITKGTPFATIVCLNRETRWYDDYTARRYRNILSHARRCYFKSFGNKLLAEKQLGCELDNAEVIANAYTIDYATPVPWPSNSPDDVLRLASVGRLDPEYKGQDVLFEALAADHWRKRDWQLTLYGAGPSRDILERFARKLELSDRICFAGYRPVSEIWVTNHALVMPSRCEGMSIAIIEALLSGRPVIATDVGGAAEVIEDGVTGFVANAPTAASVGDALERCWRTRAELEQMGRAAAEKIRMLVPPDPVDTFASKLIQILQT
jgi:glycosyltransferase involved in cell wall biosynthesis